MCYNVLCDKYATRQLYGYCPSWALNWQHRRRHIFEEIHHYGADVISLQVTAIDIELKSGDMLCIFTNSRGAWGLRGGLVAPGGHLQGRHFEPLQPNGEQM